MIGFDGWLVLNGVCNFIIANLRLCAFSCYCLLPKIGKQHYVRKHKSGFSHEAWENVDVRKKVDISQIPVLCKSRETFKQVKPQALAGCLCFCFVFFATQRKTTSWVLCESGLTKQTLIKKISGSHRGLVCFYKALIHHQTEWLNSAKWPEIPEHWPPSYRGGCKVSQLMTKQLSWHLPYVREFPN